MEHSDPDKNYKEYKERFGGMTDGQLIDAFNREVGSSGWTNSRASYLVALHEEFEKRKIVLISKGILINQPSIPEGLSKCKKCGEYRGQVMGDKDEGDIPVSCLCDGILCQKCKKNKIHRPISNSYDPETNRIWHHPYFSGMMGCGECRKSQ